MEFKIVKIVNEYLVVVNYGAFDGAREGDILEIFQVGEEVIDPHTNKSLGTLDIRKARIKVINVYDQMALCRSYELSSSFYENIGLLGKALTMSETLALNVNTEHISGGYDEYKELIINIGDPVRIINSKNTNLTGDDEE